MADLLLLLSNRIFDLLIFVLLSLKYDIQKYI